MIGAVVVCFQGSPGPPGPVGPIGPAGVRVSADRLVLMANMLFEFFKHEQDEFSFSKSRSFHFRVLKEKKDRLDPEALQGPW